MSATDIIRAYIKADIPVLLWGEPGTGKTSAVMALAREEHAHIEVLIGSQLDPIDVGGYLLPTMGTVVNVPPPWARRLREALDDGRPAWLMLDELSCAPPPVQAALLRVVNERAVGELSILGCRVLAASNPIDASADGGDLAAATSNRWAHVEWKLETSTWISGTLSGWGNELTRSEAAAASSICSWIMQSPTALLSRSSAGDGKAWPSPRSWSAAMRALAHGTPALARALVAGCVGDAAASEWHTYHSARDLPDPEALLDGTAKLPKRGDQVSASLLAVVAAALSQHDTREGRITLAWKLLASARPDCALVAARTLIDATDEVPDEAKELAARIRKAS